MALSVTANAPLVAPALRTLVEIHLDSSFPFTFPLTFGAEPVRVTTEDLPTDAAPIAGLVWERRLIEDPEVTKALSDDSGGFRRIGQITLALGNGDGALTRLFTEEHRGNLVRAHLYDVTSQALVQDAFVGVIAAIEAGLHTVSITAVAVDVSQLATPVPRTRVEAARFPFAQDIGAVLAYGWGVGERVPFRWTHALVVDAGDEYSEYDAAGNLGIAALYSDLRLVDDVTDAQILTKAKQDARGRYGTTVRFFGRNIPTSNPRSPVPITADVIRFPDVDDHVVAEWKWLRGFTEDIAGRDAIPGTAATFTGNASDITTGSLVTGFHGHGLGAIALDGTNDWLEVPNPAAFKLTTFTIELLWQAWSTTTGPLLASPYRKNGGTKGGWTLNWNGPARRLDWRFLDTSGVEQTVYGSSAGLPLRTWIYTKIGVDAVAGATRVLENGVLLGNTSTNPIVYDEASSKPLTIGVDPATTAFFKGRIGWLRISSAARDDAHVARNWRVLRRSPIEFLRDLLANELGWGVNEASFTAAETDLRAAAGGALTADGYVTQETTAQAVIDDLCAIRDIRLGTGTDGLVTCAVAKPAATVAASFGVGAPWNNVVAVTRRTRASLAEAVAAAVVEYRQARELDGTPRGTGFAFQQSAPSQPVGQPSTPRALSFVYEHRVADVVAKFRAARLAARDELLEVVVNHEGRILQPGDIGRFTIAAHGLADADYEMLSVAGTDKQRALAMVPYEEAAFTYSRTTLRAALLASPGVAGVWMLGETSGTTAADVGPNLRNGTITGSPTLGVDPITGDSATAIRLDNVSSTGQYVSVASASDFDVGASDSWWVVCALRPMHDAGAVQTLFQRKNGTPLTALRLDASGLPHVLQTDSGGTADAAGTVSLIDGAPHLLIGIRDRAALAFSLWVDGTLVGSAGDILTGAGPTGNPLWFGAAGDAAVTGNGFTGELAAVAFGKGLLTPADVARITAAYRPWPADPVRMTVLKVPSGATLTASAAQTGGAGKKLDIRVDLTQSTSWSPVRSYARDAWNGTPAVASSSRYLNVDEAVASDADYLTSASWSTCRLYLGFAPIGISGTITSVRLEVRAKHSGTATNLDVSWVQGTSDTETFQGSTALTGSFVTYTFDLPTRPGLGGDWTVADLAGWFIARVSQVGAVISWVRLTVYTAVDAGDADIGAALLYLSTSSAIPSEADRSTLVGTLFGSRTQLPTPASNGTYYLVARLLDSTGRSVGVAQASPLSVTV